MSKPFSALYERVLRWARHRHAPWYLAGLSFAESSFFPIPPDVMLAPMVLARRNMAWRYALITTLMSVLGGLLGYILGRYLFDSITPLLQQAGYWEKYEQLRLWFDVWGFWAVFLAGFSPIPYKLFTISAGVIAMALLPFILASLIGRGARFFLVAALIRVGGERMESALKIHIERIGWGVVALTTIVLIWLQLT